MYTQRYFALGIIAALALAATSTNAFADVAERGHVGAATCGSASCHNASRPWQTSSILQNEYITWSEFDRHSNAYQTLKSDEAKRIAWNLGLRPAHRSPLCLDCHSNNVPSGAREREFSLSDGVSCEACHGGAKDYLGPHVAGKNTHSDNIANGMIDIANPNIRAKVCGDCHLVNKNNFLGHRLYSAGHPRLRFELNSYTVAQPNHFRVDHDYILRKGEVSPVEVWIAGQLVAASLLADAVISQPASQQALIPELAFYDCFSCHQYTSKNAGEEGFHPHKGKAIPSAGYAFLMLKVIANAFELPQSEQINQHLELYKQPHNDKSKALAAAQALKAAAEAMQTATQLKKIKLQSVARLSTELLNEAKRGAKHRLIFAEQATMAMNAFAEQLAASTSTAEQQKLTEQLDRLYNSVDDEDNYSAAGFLRALEAVDQTLQKNH